ncbi:MAG: two-component system sensor histidine kinase/response regulator [Flavobacteriaceae bacterium CG2_30_31_66]|nr:MAG: two-component system sensor histidine kinase/response regulator [Flavobacteriaceae bacterium CG2_30_31_66]
MSDFSPKRIQLVFTLSIVTAIFSLLYFFIGLKINFTMLSYFHLTSSFIFFFCAFIVKKGNLDISRTIYFIVFNISVAVTSSYIGKPGSIEFMLLFAFALPFFIFSYRREKNYIAIFSTLALLLWILLYKTNFNLFTDSKLDLEIASKYFYPLSLCTTLILITYELAHFSYLNSSHYAKIHLRKQKAIEASSAKSRFLSMMSHEIRTPLNAIVGLSHILADTKPREDQKENIDALNYSGKILLNLLNNALDFSKMQSTEIQLDNIPTNLYEGVRQIRKIHDSNCEKKGITLKLEIDEKIPVVWLDIVRFNQVINNLLTNSVKFTDKGGVILRIKKGSETSTNVTVITEIIDTGIGIPKEKLKQVWDAFTQASSTTNRLYGGTGLGLPIVKSIIEAMGSEVKIDSVVGRGSRFYFKLNLKKALNSEIKKTDFKQTYHFEGKKVLLVEDNLINVMVGKQILEKENLIVDVANNGLIAVEKVQKNNYDVILMDIQMPVMDGYTASIEIRKFNKEIPILALSASIFMEVKDKINESGMNGFIFKPFDPKELLKEIDTFINKVPNSK